MRLKGSPGGFIIFCWIIGILGSGWLAGSACRRPAEAVTGVAGPLAVDVGIDRPRARAGETIAVTVAVNSRNRLRGLKVSGRLFVPTRGAVPFDLKEAGPDFPHGKNEARYRGSVAIGPNPAEGFYALTVEAALGNENAFGKANFLVGKIIADFLPVSALPAEDLEQDLRSYYEDFRKVGGNLVIIHNFITDKALYPSKICAKAAAAGSPDDKVTVALRLAEQFGLTSLLSAGWDMTRFLPSAERLASTKEVITELWKIYASSPALAGFYSYQEGSGTYLAAQMREFAAAVKSQDRGLLTACAPYIDDPLLAGYLASIDDLDIVIYQGAVMASYRPDNRKCFPPRRTKDFTGLSAGATRARRKITVSHVELFGYLEKQVAGVYLAGPKDIRSQILSAATAFGPDGISFFNYYYCIHLLGKKVPEVKASRQAVLDAIADYNLIARSAAASSSRIGVYIPYSDWWTDRWTNIIVPALDACRRLGVSPDILPFVPPPGEEVLPYYPLHLNPEQLAFFQANNYVLLIPDIGGLQDTDAFLIKEFIEGGGTVVFFGPRIPYTRAYDRNVLCGGRENPPAKHSGIRVLQPLRGRTVAGQSFRFAALESPSWTAAAGKVVAAFEDGSAALLTGIFGKGRSFTFPLTLAEAVRGMPDLVRDVLDVALGKEAEGAGGGGASRLFDVAGLDEDSDIAMSTAGKARVIVVVNYKPEPVKIDIRPLGLYASGAYALTDLRTGRLIREGSGRDLAHLNVSVPPADFAGLSVVVKE